MDIVTIKTLDKQAQEEDDNKIKFFYTFLHSKRRPSGSASLNVIR